MRSATLGLAVLVSTLGCHAPLVGVWESDKTLENGKKNEMAVDSDDTGEATIHATPPSQTMSWVTFEFDIDWSEDGDEFDLEMSCKKGPCDNDDFEMTCQVIDEGGGDPHKLDCEVTKNARWQQYPFDWEKQ